MKKLTILLITLLTAGWANAQVRLSGKVRDNRNHIVAGASVQVKGSYDGGVSDSVGHFSFKTFEKGQQTIVVSNVGYKSVEQVITIGTDTTELFFQLKEEVTELKAVTVTAGSFEAGDKKKAATVLSSLDVVTTGGANADISAVVKTLPGAQQVGEQEGLFVRGGAGYETKQFIDGTMVNNPYYSSVPDLAQRGRFSPFLFKGTVFSTGGYSALYGQALSSALILESVDVPDRSEAQASISPIIVGGGLQEVAKDKKSSWGIQYNYTNLVAYFQVIKQTPDYFHVPAFHAADANFRIKTKGGIIKYYTTFAANHLGLRRPNIDDHTLKNAFELQNTNWYNNLSWKESLGNGWKMNLGASFSTDHNIISNRIQDQNNLPKTTGLVWIDSTNFNATTRGDLSQVKAVFDKRLSGISVIRFGGEYMYSYNKGLYNNYNSLLGDHFKALFTEADLYITNDLAAKAGVRLEHSSLLGKANIAPRLSLAYKTGTNAQMSVAYGEFYQKPENNFLYGGATNFGYTKATHYIANYIKTTTLQTFRIEAFYKKYTDLVKTYPSYSNDGSGYAQGVELFWRDKKSIKNLDYWISYSYLDTKRDYLNYPKQMQPNFAANHTASLVLKRFVTSWNTGFNFTYSFATGRPYYLLVKNGAKYDIQDEGKTISYNSLGFSMNYLQNMGKAYGVFVLSVTNVLNNNQVFGYNYGHDGHKEEITTAAPRFIFFGLFLSWGVDRTQDAINGNL